MRHLSFAAVIVAFQVLLLAGCGGSSQNAERESSNLKPLAVFHGRYLGAHRGKPPANEEELKAFIRTQPAAELQAFGVKDVESLFISSRDKKPYRFVFAKTSGVPQGLTVFAYEEEGVGGKRYVAGTLGQVEEVDEARFRELVPNAK